MKHVCSLLAAILAVAASSVARPVLTVTNVARNAVRIQYAEKDMTSDLPDWIYVRHDAVSDCNLRVVINGTRLTIKDQGGKVVFSATRHELQDGVATLTFQSAKDEYLYGLGQFQDGFSNIRGLSRRLTQVNTQISIPMLLSSKGYGVLWNNYGLTEFNPCGNSLPLIRRSGEGRSEEVDVTSTEGTKRERRERYIFEATLDIAHSGDYALLLDVGQKMARRHNLVIDGKPVIEMQNLWLPPTASTIVHLTKGRHQLTAELTKDDHPVLY